MNPWITIWIRTNKTIDEIKASNWVNKGGLLPYFMAGFNGVSETKIALIIGSGSRLEGLAMTLFAGVFVGMIAGGLLRVFWVNIIYHFGKMWKGASTKRNIDTVISFALMPELFKLIYIAASFLLVENISEASISYPLSIVCFVLSISILIHGISRVQEFGYVFAVLNVMVPQIILMILYYGIRGI